MMIIPTLNNLSPLLFILSNITAQRKVNENKKVSIEFSAHFLGP